MICRFTELSWKQSENGGQALWPRCSIEITSRKYREMKIRIEVLKSALWQMHREAAVRGKRRQNGSGQSTWGHTSCLTVACRWMVYHHSSVEVDEKVVMGPLPQPQQATKREPQDGIPYVSRLAFLELFSTNDSAAP